MTVNVCPLPVADGATGLEVLKGLVRERSLLTALACMHRHVGNAFQITLPAFRPAVFVGPAANRQILVTERHRLLWRNETDPVVKLLREGVLVIDGAYHDEVRALMDPPLRRRHVLGHIPTFWRLTERLSRGWQDGETYDMLVEMRRLALFLLFEPLFGVDLTADLPSLWQPILKLLKYISPGLWLIWPAAPRPGYGQARQVMDAYLYDLIRRRRRELAQGRHPDEANLLDRLILAETMDDDRIRDQLLTMLIAGHDTSTALLAWTFYLLGTHPEAKARVQAEADAVLGDGDEPPTAEVLGRLHFTDQVIKETLRLYPPIHVGNRRAAEDLVLQGYRVPAGTRVMYSIYLTHRDPAEWPAADAFRPERFDAAARKAGAAEESAESGLRYVPFGGGPRNCIGAAFAQVEARVVLAYLFRHFDFELLNAEHIRPYMGATLEPRPGVLVRVRRRRSAHALASRPL
ncbi:MAG: cytochrome P450 [Caldilineales bacterium]|nr:cytochrome P450 [Caldilineales bacterium]